MKKILIVALAVFTLTAQSCKKKSNEPEPPSAKELLTQDDWLLTEYKFVDNSGNTVNQFFPNTKWIFAPSGDYYFYDNLGDLTEYGEWQLLNDDTKIRLIENSGSYDYIFEIDKLESDRFEISMNTATGTQYFYLER